MSLPQRLAKLDKLSGYEKQFEIIEGILAGNVFDWGAKEVVKLVFFVQPPLPLSQILNCSEHIYIVRSCNNYITCIKMDST